MCVTEAYNNNHNSNIRSDIRMIASHGACGCMHLCSRLSEGDYRIGVVDLPRGEVAENISLNAGSARAA